MVLVTEARGGREEGMGQESENKGTFKKYIQTTI